MEMRLLTREEVEGVWTIDRREVHHHLYRLRDGELELTPAYFEIEGWWDQQVAQDTPLLYVCFDRGGTFTGIFEEGKLIGVVVVDCVPLGKHGDWLQLSKLYVSHDYRKQGIGSQLFSRAKEVAKARGAKSLYVSATPTENTVNFYLGRGCELCPDPDPELLALEPEDIHLICAV